MEPSFIKYKFRCWISINTLKGQYCNLSRRNLKLTNFNRLGFIVFLSFFLFFESVRRFYRSFFLECQDLDFLNTRTTPEIFKYETGVQDFSRTSRTSKNHGARASKQYRAQVNELTKQHYAAASRTFHQDPHNPYA